MKTKLVESGCITCLDEGSIPSDSTKRDKLIFFEICPFLFLVVSIMCYCTITLALYGLFCGDVRLETGNHLLTDLRFLDLGLQK